MREEELGNLLDVIIDHRGKTPKKLGGVDFTDAGVPVVSAIHIKNGRINLSERRRYVPQWMFEKWMPVRLRAGDLLLTSEAPLGEIAQVQHDGDLVLSQRLFALRGKPGRLDSTYLRYFLQSREGQQRLLHRASGTTVFGIRQSELVRVKVPVPSIQEQRRIAGVLGALDDLIDTNTRLTSSCTSLSEASFQRMLSSAQESRNFSEIVDILSGGTPQTSVAEYWGGNIPWFSVVDTPGDGEAWVLRSAKHITERGLQNSPAQLLEPGTTIITARGTVGNVGLVGVPMALNQSCYGLRSRVGSHGYFTFFATLASVEALRRRAHGSVFDTITRASFDAIKTPLPPLAEIEAFESLVDPLMQQARQLLLESDALRRSRDELLPLLLSGRVRVVDVTA